MIRCRARSDKHSNKHHFTDDQSPFYHFLSTHVFVPPCSPSPAPLPWYVQIYPFLPTSWSRTSCLQFYPLWSPGCGFFDSPPISVSGEVYFLSLSPGLLCQVCVLAYFSFRLPTKDSQKTRSLVRSPDNFTEINILTPKGSHQLVWLTSFSSHHYLPYHLVVRHVSLYVLVYGFLLFWLSLATLKRSLTRYP